MSLMEYHKIYNEKGEPVLNQVACAELHKLAEIVLNKHFSYVSYHDRQDLVAEGILKAITLIKAGRFDPKRASLKNYLYTGMRNEMCNYLYRNKKEIPIEEFYEHSEVMLEEMKTDIPYQVVDRLTREMVRGNHRYLSQVCKELERKGFIIIGKPEKKSPVLNNPKVVEKLVSLVIWKKQEYCL